MITVTHTIDHIDRIEAEARDAARQHADLNAACPYPFGSIRAGIFSAAFHQARAEQQPLEGSDQ